MHFQYQIQQDRELISGAPNSVQDWTVEITSATSKLLSLINCYYIYVAKIICRSTLILF